MSAIFEQDINGDYQPTGLAGAVAINFELDPNGDIMPRTAPRIAAKPLGLAASDPATDGDLLISISNGASYLLGERIDVYDNATNLLLGSFDAAVGSGKISGLANATAYTVYATAGGDTFEDSAASATATATPTTTVSGGVADYPAVGDVESGVIFDSGNKTGTFAVPAVSDVRTAIGYGANGVEFIGSLIVSSGAIPSTGNMMADGAAWHKSQLRAHVGEVVFYQRGIQSVSLRATIAETSAETLDATERVSITVRNIDFVIATEDLILGGILATPAAGDTVERTIGTETVKYEVLPVNNASEYRASDRYGHNWRVHTKEISRV